MPAPVSSSDEEETQGLAIVLRRLAALEKDNAILKNQLKASQPRAGMVRSKSARVANKRSRTEDVGQVQAPVRPVCHEEHPRPSTVPASEISQSTQEAAQPVLQASSLTASQEEHSSQVLLRTSPVAGSSQATQGESAQYTPAAPVWPAVGPWASPPWNMGQMWPFSPPIEHEEQGLSEDTTQALNGASAMVLSLMHI